VQAWVSKGRLSQFSLDALVNIASNAGLNVRMVVRRRTA